MSSFQFIHRVSVSLAHRYWLAELSEQENQELFGRSSSPEGLGHNMELELIFRGDVSADAQQEFLREVKQEWDHVSWFDRQDLACSSVELMLWDLVQKRGSLLVAVSVAESRDLKVSWTADRPSCVRLAYRRPLSVLWKDPSCGGARLDFRFEFEGEFGSGKPVLFPRPLLERTLEEKLCQMEALGIELSLKVKENKAFLDAMFNEVQKDLPDLISIACELQHERKWLIHSPILSR